MAAAAADNGSVADTVAWRDRKHGGEVFMVFANPGMTAEWRRAPDKVNLADVLQSNEVFHEGSSNADPGRASRALLACACAPARWGGAARD